MLNVLLPELCSMFMLEGQACGLFKGDECFLGLLVSQLSAMIMFFFSIENWTPYHCINGHDYCLPCLNKFTCSYRANECFFPN